MASRFEKENIEALFQDAREDGPIESAARDADIEGGKWLVGMKAKCEFPVRNANEICHPFRNRTSQAPVRLHDQARRAIRQGNPTAVDGMPPVPARFCKPCS